MNKDSYYATRPLVRAQAYQKIAARLREVIGDADGPRSHESDLINSALILIREAIYRLESEATK